ncbi:MAG: ATP-binding protein [Jatrophihabitantaceae bacterium]
MAIGELHLGNRRGAGYGLVMSAARSLVPRNLTAQVEEALVDTRIVVVQGARQVGKSTLLREVVDRHNGRMITLDDELTRTAATADPVGFVGQYPTGLLGIDEAQRVPELVLALKAAVDADPRPGRFLLTGSADLLRLPATQDSLAGRAESLELFGFSQGELVGVREGFLDRLLDGSLFGEHRSDLTRHDYLLRACAGGYPEVLARPSERRRAAWLDGYVQRIIGRDAADVSGLQRLGDLPRLVRLLATRTATELNVASIANDSGIPPRTLPPYLDLLETLYLIQRIPAWSTNLSKRVIARPKLILLDSGLAARLTNVSATGAGRHANPTVAGQLIETFAIGEIRRQLGWAEQPARVHHYREQSGAEIDIVVETSDGRVAALEVKSAATIRPADIRWLTALRDRLGHRFAAGLLLHTGPNAQPLGDRLAAVPLDILWSEPAKQVI